MSVANQSESVETKRLVENLLSDFRSLSTEAKKKHVQVKESSESGLAKIRNIHTASNGNNLMTNLRACSGELLHPLLLGCSSKNPRLVQISLQAIQRMIQHKVVETNSARIIVNELWDLMESECEELRILQTLTPLVSTELVVTGQWLAKCLVICFRLNFAKDPVVINTASATVRQLVNSAFERVVQEDQSENKITPTAGRSLEPTSKSHNLSVCGEDGYALFRDLCLLINAEQPLWLIGIQEMTRTLGLELIESVLAGYPSIFKIHVEYAQLLKDHLCPLITKLFAPNHKNIKICSQHPCSLSSRASVESASVGQLSASPERPHFPISMRLLRVLTVLISNFYELLVTECEIFLSLMIKLLEPDKLAWQKCAALEVLHRIIPKPELLLWFCENYDSRSNSVKVVHSIVANLVAVIQQTFILSDSELPANREDDQLYESSIQPPGQPLFFYRGNSLQLYPSSGLKKALLLDSLDKHEPVPPPKDYALTIAYHCITDCCHAVFQVIECGVEHTINDELKKTLFESTSSSLLAAVSLLLDASVDESITEQLLLCCSAIVKMSCHLHQHGSRDAAVFVLCKATLPPNYLVRVLGGAIGMSALPRAVCANYENDDEIDEEFDNGQQQRVIAVGMVCPTPACPANLLNTAVMLTTKNLQVLSTLITSTQANGQRMDDCWHLILATIQHIVWILGMKPSFQGGFRTEGEGNDVSVLSGAQVATTQHLLTTAVMAEVPVVSSLLTTLFDSTAELDDVALHHVIAALCKLSLEAMQVSGNGTREPSFFPVSKLMHTGMANLSRLEVFWKPVTAHLNEVSTHSYPSLREWGVEALTTLIMSALKSQNIAGEEKKQHLILVPLQSLCEIEYVDVRRKQMECLMAILQSVGEQLTAEQWPTIITIVVAVVGGKFSFDEGLIKQSYEAVSLIVTDFLDALPLGCLQMFIETATKYGAQQCELNISLSALGQLWTIGDYISRQSTPIGEVDREKLWLVLYNCLSELCVDGRPPVRKSACQTLLQTISAHGVSLKAATWKHMVWNILFPMLDRVRALARSASTSRTDSTALGASNILIHHSRDTESKQWAETCVHTLGGVVKIFNMQRNLLLTLDNFSEAWDTVLKYIEYFSASNNLEMSLAALKSFQEILLGKISAQTLDVNTRERYASFQTNLGSTGEKVPDLPNPQWLSSWKTWISISRSLLSPHSTPNEFTPCGVQGDSSEKSANNAQKSCLPGPSHFTTLLHVYPPLFERVKGVIPVDDLKYDVVPSILKGIIAVPVSSDQTPFILTTATEITPTQEAILDSVKVMYEHMVTPNSRLRPALPDLLRLMLDFVLAAVRTPPSELCSGKKDFVQWWFHNNIVFAELSLRKMLEFYANTAHYAEVIDSTVLIDILQCLTEPMKLKYRCYSQNTWKAAASAFVTVCRIGLPIARKQPNLFKRLWPQLTDTFEQFLFGQNQVEIPPNADERKRHEYIDCQLIDLIRSEILPYVGILPADFMEQIIDLLNRGSITKLDPNDVMALDSYQQRTDLSRLCFDALLSMSQCEESSYSSSFDRSSTVPKSISANSSVSQPSKLASTSSSANLGCSAISSLLSRCKEVLAGFTRDEQGAGNLNLPYERIVEMLSILNAVSTLIEGLVRRPNALQTGYFRELVNLYPVLVDCIPSCRCDRQVEQALTATLKSYEMIMRLKLQSQ